MKKYRIAQIGAFDFENYGDLLFVDVFEKQIKRHIELDEIVLFAPKNCTMPFSDGRKVYSVTELEEQHKEKPFDAFVVGGGDIIHYTKTRTFMPHISDDWVDYEVLYIWMIPAILAWKYDIPLLWNAPGVPMEFWTSEKMMTKELVELADYISVRDELSANNLIEAGVEKDVHVVPDTVFSISELVSEEEINQYFEKVNLPAERKQYVVFHANQTFGEKEIQDCIDVLRKIKKEHGMEIVLLPIGYALGDENFISELKARCPGEFITFDEKLSPMEMLSVIVNANAYVGASLHGCITASSFGVPVVSCNYNRFIKVDGFLEVVNLKDALVYEPEKIYPVYNKMLAVSVADRKATITLIDRHFKRLAEKLEGRPSRKGFERALCEYVFETKNRQNFYEQKLNEAHQELNNRENEWSSRYQELSTRYHALSNAFDTISQSTVWKSTKPIRMILDKLKRR